jgi:hypothetical protein
LGENPIKSRLTRGNTLRNEAESNLLIKTKINPLKNTGEGRTINQRKYPKCKRKYKKEKTPRLHHLKK